jgi:hypothetical protein
MTQTVRIITFFIKNVTECFVSQAQIVQRLNVCVLCSFVHI